MSIMLSLDLIPLALAKLPHTLAESSIFILSECTVVSLIITDHRDHFYLPTSQQILLPRILPRVTLLSHLCLLPPHSLKKICSFYLVCWHFLYNIYILWFGVVFAVTREYHIWKFKTSIFFASSPSEVHYYIRFSSK